MRKSPRAAPTAARVRDPRRTRRRSRDRSWLVETLVTTSSLLPASKPLMLMPRWLLAWSVRAESALRMAAMVDAFRLRGLACTFSSSLELKMFCHHVDQLLHLGFQAKTVVVDGEGVVLALWLLDGKDCVAALLWSSLLRKWLLVFCLTSLLTFATRLSVVFVVRVVVKVLREEFVKEKVVRAVRKKRSRLLHVQALSPVKDRFHRDRLVLVVEKHRFPALIVVVDYVVVVVVLCC